MCEHRDELPRHALVLADGARDDGIGEHQDGRDERETTGTQARADPTESREYQRRRDAGRHEREYHARQRLRGVSGELLEGESVAEPRPVAERIDAAQEIEPAHAGGDGDRGERPGGEPARHPQWKVAALLVALAWLVVGVYGVVGYGHNYWRYRGFAPPVDRGTLVKVEFWSQAMRGMRFYEIYLPPGYETDAARGIRFPVLYMLHGSPPGDNLFINAAGAGMSLDRLVLRRQVRPYLLVMPNGGDGSFMSDTEWADTPHGRYQGFVMDVVRAVDARWPTLPGRRYRGIAGNSEGGYGALNIALHHPLSFSLAESWSGYYTQQASGVFAHLPRAAVAANSPALYVARLAPLLHRLPFLAVMYTSWKDQPLAMRHFASELRAAGGQVSADLFGGGHSWQLWRRETPRMMRIAGLWFGYGR